MRKKECVSDRKRKMMKWTLWRNRFVQERRICKKESLSRESETERETFRERETLELCEFRRELCLVRRCVL